MSRTSKRVIISTIFISMFFFSTIYSQIITLGSAWERGSGAENPLIAISGGTAELNGSLDEGWDYVWGLANTSTEEIPSSDLDVKLYTMIFNNYFFLMVEVQKLSHDPDEYIRLLISNSTDDDDDDFFDAKLIQNRNFTSEGGNVYDGNHTVILSDQFYNETLQQYVNDSSTDIDFSGTANITFVYTKSHRSTHSFYEFKMPFYNPNNPIEQDSALNVTSSYAFRIQYGYDRTSENGGSPTNITSNTIYIQIGEKITEEGGYGGDSFDFSQYIDVIANSFFIIALIAFIGIGVTTFQARTKLD
ncbi:MAG: hypothetical protein GY870_11855 [archaeon]|nr:hypothetical protein [archaeon]